MNFRGRRTKVLSEALALGADSALITHLPDVRYVTGFTGSSAAVVLHGRSAVLFTDGRYTTQARQEAAGTRVAIVKGPPAAAACSWIESAGVLRCCFQPEHLTVAQFEALRKSFSPASRRRLFLPAPGLVSRIREVKEPAELDLMRRAADLGSDLFDQLLGAIEPSMPEFEVALTLEAAARRAGADAMSFETIVASGPRSALPHGRASSACLPHRGFVTLDFGVVFGGYCSDMTRTVHLGRSQPEERRVYDAVLEAQTAAVEAVRPGIPAHTLDSVARDILRKARLDRYFTHSTGHGVGLEIHEGPRLAAKQQQELCPGMVITIEPGAYLPGLFGVRIEDMVLITETGHEVLTRSPKAYIEL